MDADVVSSSAANGEEMICPNCHLDDSITTRRDRRLVECRRCGLLRIRPRMSSARAAAEIEKRYSKPRRFTSGNPVAEASRHDAEVRIIRSLLSSRADALYALDVGAGYGSLVHCLSLHGVNAVGIDPFPGFVEIARKHGVDIRCGSFASSTLGADLLARRFDLICFRGSICYIDNLEDCFALVRRLLNPGGWVYLYMHVLDSAYYRGRRDILSRYGPFVSFVPTRGTLRRLLQRNGLRVELERGIVGSGSDLLFGRRWRLIGAAVDAVLNPWIAATKRHDAVIYMAQLDAQPQTTA